MNILAIGAHPDDIEIGCAGTLIKYRQQGHQVYSLVMTEGQRGGDAAARKMEQERANTAMGIIKTFWGGYLDTELPITAEVVATIEAVIRTVHPEKIFVNYFKDTHQDHRNLSQATITATRYIKNVLFYEVPTTHDFSPTIFVDIKDVFAEKTRVLETHQSQVMKTNIGDRSIVDVAQAQAGFRGIQARIKYAEGFVPQRLFIDI